LRQVFGNHFEEVETHLDGMGIMVEQRGMQSLGVYQFGRTTRKYIFVYGPIFLNLSKESLSNSILI
jgi:hypothetical protein